MCTPLYRCRAFFFFFSGSSWHSAGNINQQEVTSQKDMRAKLEKETPTAGPGLITPNMELFCKAAADGSALGDCPFTHYIQVWSTRVRTWKPNFIEGV